MPPIRSVRTDSARNPVRLRGRSMALPRTVLAAVAAAIPLAFLGALLPGNVVSAQSDTPTLEIAWPPAGSTLPIGPSPEVGQSLGIVVRSNFKLMPAGQCGGQPACGHVHMKIDPDGDSCNLPGRPYNGMNSDFGGNLVEANFGACPSPAGQHVIGVLLADDQHRPVLVGGRPVTALLPVRTEAVR